MGFRERVKEVLNRAGLKVTLFDQQVEAEPRLEVADEGAKAALKGKCDIVVGIGGGSAMDIAKAIAVLAANKNKAVDYLGLDKVPGPGLPKNHDSDDRRYGKRSYLYCRVYSAEVEEKGGNEQSLSIS